MQPRRHFVTSQIDEGLGIVGRIAGDFGYDGDLPGLIQMIRVLLIDLRIRQGVIGATSKRFQQLAQS